MPDTEAITSFSSLRREIGATFPLAQLPRVGNDDLVTGRPSRRRRFEHECRLPCQRLFGQPAEGRRFDRAVHPDFAESLDAGADLRRIEPAVDRLIGDDDFGGDVLRDRLCFRADLEDAFLHDRQVADVHPRARVGPETEMSVQLDAVESRVADDVVDDIVAGNDADLVARAWHLLGRPCCGIRPRAGLAALVTLGFAQK